MKKVDLVFYNEGERVVLGEAVVHDDGTIIEAQLHSEVTLPEALKQGYVIGNSLSLAE